MNKKKGYLSTIIGLSIMIGLAGVVGCTSNEPATAANYYNYTPSPTKTYIQTGSGIWRMTMDQVEEMVDDYLDDLNDSNLQAEEIIEFAFNFYIRFSEKNTGINAFEALIDPYSGRMFPAHGPFTMWNTKYTAEPIDVPTGPMAVSEEQAWRDAQAIIDESIPDGVAGDVQSFYGYYTVPAYKDGDLIGLFSINGYTGTVCYQSCHGSIVEIRDLR